MAGVLFSQKTAGKLNSLVQVQRTNGSPFDCLGRPSERPNYHSQNLEIFQQK
ncbi:hypothetical protein RHMOL_Rhmol09G0155600 [Rhododendron molle]|uniref:Uncharacterized protein n=1 Tax=Rhododendron molle TaxID=49168 RepID=A0ACC0MDJ6_RHOML|nr:hypothetical protein RHMOL_Rhmol09G0155600 [Rhododendron molle]